MVTFRLVMINVQRGTGLAGRSKESLTMAYDIAADIRLDPRLKAILAGIPLEGGGDVDSRETMLAEAATPRRRASRPSCSAASWRCATPRRPPRQPGCSVHTEKVISQPDGNTINLQVIRPDNDETVACVYYIHGGGMASLSCYDGMYRGWGKIIAAQRRRGRHGRLPQRRRRVLRARGRPVPGRAQRLRLRPEVGRRQRRAPRASTRPASSSRARAAAAT